MLTFCYGNNCVPFVSGLLVKSVFHLCRDITDPEGWWQVVPLFHVVPQGYGMNQSSLVWHVGGF